MNINLVCLADLPKLAWVACLESTGKLTVYHGSSVECGEGYLVEGVWDAPFSEGNFHLSENFFGSGIRVCESKVYFISSSSNQDRLIFCEDQQYLIVANSLPLILAYTGASLDSDHSYFTEANGFKNGVRGYSREFRVTHPSIQHFNQVFYENIIWYKGNVTFQTRSSHHVIPDYETYLNKLKTVLHRISDNFKAKERVHKIAGYSTISSGYDSPTVSCLVRDIGVYDSYTSRKSNSALPDFFSGRVNDDGTPIAMALGLNIGYLADPKLVSEDELYYLSVICPKGQGTLLCEIVYDSLGKKIENNGNLGVIFNGNHGDAVWDAKPPAHLLTDQIIRIDTCGMSLMEVRLKHGYFNIALPFIFATDICEIVKISNSAELAPWKLGNDYDRPIARRILESAGVKRGMFAQRKKAVVTFYQYPINKLVRRQFLEYLSSEYKIGKFTLLIYLTQLSMSRLLGRIIHLLGGYLKPGQILIGDSLDLPFLTWMFAIDSLKTGIAKTLKPYIKSR